MSFKKGEWVYISDPDLFGTATIHEKDEYGNYLRGEVREYKPISMQAEVSIYFPVAKYPTTRIVDEEFIHKKPTCAGCQQEMMYSTDETTFFCPKCEGYL